jgi:tetratricopeptide (TPR) repeat protein
MEYYIRGDPRPISVILSAGSYISVWLEEIMAIMWLRYSILVVCLGFASQFAVGQGTTGTAGRPSNTPSGPNPGQTVVVSGSVIVEGGGTLPEPAAIERLCRGAIRREGYTDSKGQFQVVLGMNDDTQGDAESGAAPPGASNLPMLAMPPLTTNMSKNMDAVRRQLAGCQMRAVLAGFQSSLVQIIPEGNSWQIQVGKIVLRRLEQMEGSVVSLTTLEAPVEAKRVFDKAQHELEAENFSSAEKHLKKAVEIFPRFAAAWVLLGEIHRRQNQPDAAKQDYTEAVTADPQFVNGYFGLAMLAVKAKSWDETVNLTNQIVTLNSAAFPSAYLYNSVANFYLGKLDVAEESVRKFQTMDPDRHEPYAYLLHAQILAAMHRYPQAADELQTYLRLAPGAADGEALRAQLSRYQSKPDSR